MTRKPLPHDELPERSRDDVHFGQQGLALPTYGEELEETQRGVDVIDLSEQPAAPVIRPVVIDATTFRRKPRRPRHAR